MSFGRKDLSSRAVSENLPEFDEEYFEWVDLLESVKRATGRYVLIELGASYGRWAVRASHALKRMNPMPFQAVAVGPEPTHFEFLKQHFRDNVLDLSDQRLIRAAVWAKGGPVKFHIGNASKWYGQAIDQSKGLRSSRQWVIILLRILLYRMRLLQARRLKRVMTVPALTLSEILSEYQCVDLVDLDIQGAELDVVSESLKTLNEEVKLMHIGIHNASVEEGLQRIFRENGWLNVWNYWCKNIHETPYGSIFFQDGVQTYANPAFRGQ
jgi:FkbM family methyltransferase